MLLHFGAGFMRQYADLLVRFLAADAARDERHDDIFGGHEAGKEVSWVTGYGGRMWCGLGVEKIFGEGLIRTAVLRLRVWR